MKVKAAVLYEPNTPIVVKEVELDPPKANEVLVKMVASGVCHSDYHIVTGDLPSNHYPIICGHEGAGIVESVGPQVTRVKPGDHVVMSFLPSCGQCHYCRTGQTNLCNQGAHILNGPQLDGTFRFHDGETGIGQLCLVSTFSEYTVVPEMSVVKIEDDIPLQLACLVGCGVGTGVGAVINRAKVREGSSVVVIGLGGIGMNAVQGARLAGATKIIVADINASKLEKAKQFGATHFINSSTEDVMAKVKEITYNEGVDYSFLTVDYVTPELIGQAYWCIRKGGTCVVVGLSNPKYQTTNIMPLDLVLTEKTVMGTLYGKSEPFTDIPRYLELHNQGKLDLQGLVTKNYTLEQVNEAFEDMMAGKNIRGVILY